jgi:hypothetical protein
VVKSKEKFVFKNGSFSVDQINQYLVKQTLLLGTLQRMAGFTVSLVSEVRIVRVFV